MNEKIRFTDLTISSKAKNVSLKKYFDSIKRNLPENWSWLRDRDYDDKETFFIVEETIFIKTPYFKNEQYDLIYFGVLILGLTENKIILLDIEILNLINNEDLKTIYSKEEILEPRALFLNIFSKEILKKNKYFESFNHTFEFGGNQDENWFKHDIRDERSIKLHAKDTNKIYFFGKGKQAKHADKSIIYFSPNNISLSLSLMKKAYKKSQKQLIKLLENRSEKLIKLSENDKDVLYEYFESITTSIIFAYIAVESFANAAIPEDYIYEKINDRKIKESWTKENIERWLSTSQKICEILPIVLKTDDIKEQEFWLKFKKLEKIRNEIVHQKTIESGTKLDSDLYNKLLEKDIFKTISSSLSVIEFFYDYDNAHPYFPLGLGIAKFQLKEIENIDAEFGSYSEVE
ncbi:hypothetical protein QWY90_08290 [Flavobacterium paronense]|uniref:Apea-like HEPN domain-containing protein n=1 Tax=Flavobacterium paronense TaxID=1392775 RepID=A0ABV5GH31_9FLAO|nr:hypothetical protein [Flavobacterium paronense]MDN3677313.1 hypothetical protein [Flavobacterium paronense]